MNAQTPLKPDCAARAQILVVDGDVEIQKLVCSNLAAFRMRAQPAFSAEEMWSAMQRSTFDLIVMDLVLPDEDGLALCRSIRRTSDVPIIIATCRSEPTERVVGLELGADDYLSKPFDVRELVARIHTVLRRTRGASTLSSRQHSAIGFANWTLKLLERELVAGDGSVVPLSNSLYLLLRAFVSSPRRVLTRDALMNATHGRPAGAFDRSVDNHVAKLRQILGDDRDDPRLIKTVRGAGYLFCANVTLI